MVLGYQYGYRHSVRPASAFPLTAALIARAALALLLLFALARPALTQDRVLDLSGPVDFEQVGGHIDYLIDPGHALGIEDVTGPLAGDFRPVETEVADFNYTDAMIWLRLKVTNRSEEASDWRLYFHENFKQIFHVYVMEEDGGIVHPLALELDSPFTARPVAFPEVVVPLRIPPGATATVFTRYWTEGSTNLPLSVETVESFTAISAHKSAKNFTFYGMMLVMIAAAMLAMVLIRHPIFPAYVAYASSTLLYLMHSDGAAFQYLWPGFPLFNSYASVLIGASYVIFGALFARLFLDTPAYHPWIDKVLVALIVVPILMVASTLMVETRIIKKMLILVAFLGVAVFTVAGLVAARRRFKRVRFFVFAWLGATISAGMMTGRHWFGVEISQEFQYDSMRVVMIFDAVMMGLAIVDRYSQLRAEKQFALQSSLDHARRNLDMTERLRELESRYDLAVQTTARRDRELAGTIHDLRQPLHALRLAVHGAISGKPDDKKGYSDINDSFDYLETLVSGHLDEAAARYNDISGRKAGDDAAEMSLDDILSGIHEMFLPDTQSKGLRFDYVPTSSDVPVEPLAVMRIVTNLISNAIKYTGEGRILLGMRHRENGIRIEVHDTGPGLDEGAFRDVCRHSVRIAEENGPDGHGLGLAIVTELAAAHGYEVAVLDRGGGGTSIGVLVPYARQINPSHGQHPPAGPGIQGPAL